MFQGMNDTDYLVHSMRFQERLAKSERFHALTRDDGTAEKKPGAWLEIRMPRISVIRRVVQILPGPA
jgi:hypothetical protein